MESQNEQTNSTHVDSLLSSLRSRIRGYVWVEGIAVALAWLGLTFWVAIALDYLPVFFGMSELPWQARAFLLIVIASVLFYLLYRYVVRRAFVEMHDRSMALILERRFKELDDSLITSVEANEKTRFAALKERSTTSQEGDSEETGDAEMLRRTQRMAETKISDLKVSQVFNLRPLLFSSCAALLLVVSIGIFAFANTENFLLGAKRVYLLDKKPWPRRSLIELVGAKVHRDNPIENIDEIGQTIPFEDGELRIAEGASMTLLVRAASADDSNPDRKVPSTCSVIYRTSDGQRGTQAMKKIGSPRNGFQLYTLDTEPFKGILNDMEFELRGGDHRVGPFNVTVVDIPTVVRTQVECKFPQYMIDKDSGRWTDRTVEWSSGMQLPEGTRFTIRCQSNKDLDEVFMFDKNANEMQRISVEGGDTFSVEFKSLEDAVSLDFILKDRDGVIAEDPHRIAIGSIEDQAPRVETRLLGIGSAVTPDVRIPFGGSIEDDYGTKRTWVEVETGVTDPLEENFATGSRGKIETAIDFREKRQADEGFTLPTEPESRITLVVKAEDKFDLAGRPSNVGIGDQFVLDVVAPEQLLRILDRSEVNQRKRLELIFEELGDVRTFLEKTQAKRSGSSGVVEPGDEPGDKTNMDPAKLRELRLLYAQRATLQVQKSIQELSGVAIAFDDIRMQLVNNRVDSEDRKIRLEKKIVQPMRQIVGELKAEPGRADLKSLDSNINELERLLVEIQTNRAANLESQAELLTEKSLEQIDDVMIQVNSLLAILLKYENQSELIEIVQRFLDQQKALQKRTKSEREKRAFDGLIDD